MGEVVPLRNEAVGDGWKVDPKDVLQAALDAGLKQVVIVGLGEDGDEYFASSEGQRETLWMVTAFIHWLFK